MHKVEVKQDDIKKSHLIKLLEVHHQDMLKHSPIESVHALDLSSWQSSDITFWTAWIDKSLAGCGALRIFNNQHAEIKAMRTVSKHLRKGVAGLLLEHIIKYAKKNNIEKIYLETGSAKAFEPAHKLYISFGFIDCKPFADYAEDPLSRFMIRSI